MADARRAFYEYHACLMEPWDGPPRWRSATGGWVARVDRKPPRPACHKITRDGLVVMGSEVGIVEIDDADVVEKGRSGPGEMIAVDTVHKRLLRNGETLGGDRLPAPYGEGSRRLLRLETHLNGDGGEQGENGKSNGHTAREGQQLRGPPSPQGGATCPPVARLRLDPGGPARDADADGCGGAGRQVVDGRRRPIAVLSAMPRPLYAYFRQRFAQVTNPLSTSWRGW